MSFENRFGDMLNPWGDLIAMARAWCFVKPGTIRIEVACSIKQDRFTAFNCVVFVMIEI